MQHHALYHHVPELQKTHHMYRDTLQCQKLEQSKSLCEGLT